MAHSSRNEDVNSLLLEGNYKQNNPIPPTATEDTDTLLFTGRPSGTRGGRKRFGSFYGGSSRNRTLWFSLMAVCIIPVTVVIVLIVMYVSVRNSNVNPITVVSSLNSNIVNTTTTATIGQYDVNKQKYQIKKVPALSNSSGINGSVTVSVIATTRIAIIPTETANKNASITSSIFSTKTSIPTGTLSRGLIYPTATISKPALSTSPAVTTTPKSTSQSPIPTNAAAQDYKYIPLAGGQSWRKDILVKGNESSALPVKGDLVKVYYTGYLTNGTMFETNTGPNNPPTFDFRIGRGEVIRGWDLGVATMHVGEKARLTLSPEMGYGSSGADGVIPPNAVLIFIVQVISIGK